jgi:dihydrodipicolinate synthase/N-acetylneuraminate lyase
METFPHRFAGIKDSSASPEFAQQVGAHFGKDLLVLNGNDGLFSLALENQAGGCITAMANIYAQLLRRVWDAFQAGTPDLPAQVRLGKLRLVLESVPPFPPLLKGLTPHLFSMKHWPVRPPLLPVPDTDLQRVLAALADAQASS